jgi:hypothetical protein
MPLPWKSRAGPRVPSIRRAVAIVAAVALLELIAVGSIYWSERSRLERDMFRSFYREGPSSDRSEFFSDGIRQPPTRSAEDARLADVEEVIGVEVGGKARAYRLEAMKNRGEHIINDIVSGVPVTVTYCDVANCVRAFTNPKGDAPLDISLGGLKGDRMVVIVGGTSFFQDSGQPLDPGAAGTAFPYESFRATRTRWKSWKEAHPDTEVYVGAWSDGPR